LAEGAPAALAALAAIQHVNNRFADWLGDAAALRRRREDVLFIGFQERLEADAARLAGLLGLAAAPALPEDPVLAHRRLPADRVELEPAAAAALRRYLAADYALLDEARALRRWIDAGRPAEACPAPAEGRDLPPAGTWDSVDG